MASIIIYYHIIIIWFDFYLFNHTFNRKGKMPFTYLPLMKSVDTVISTKELIRNTSIALANFVYDFYQTLTKIRCCSISIWISSRESKLYFSILKWHLNVNMLFLSSLFKIWKKHVLPRKLAPWHISDLFGQRTNYN